MVQSELLPSESGKTIAAAAAVDLVDQTHLLLQAAAAADRIEILVI